MLGRESAQEPDSDLFAIGGPVQLEGSFARLSIAGREQMPTAVGRQFESRGGQRFGFSTDLPGDGQKCDTTIIASLWLDILSGRGGHVQDAVRCRPIQPVTRAGLVLRSHPRAFSRSKVCHLNDSKLIQRLKS